LFVFRAVTEGNGNFPGMILDLYFGYLQGDMSPFFHLFSFLEHEGLYCKLMHTDVSQLVVAITLILPGP